MKKAIFAILALASALLVGACATPAPGGQTAAKSPAVTVYQIESNYAAALQVAVAYKNLPRCGLATSPVICSKSEVIAKLQKADDVAFPALQAAQNTVRMSGAGANAATALRAANEAVQALTAITATLQTE